jgi:outer membrane protein assembly factor BamA
VAGTAIYEIQEKTFVDEVSLLTQYPFSTTHRFEASAGYTRVSYSVTADRYFFVGNEQVSATSVTQSSPDDLNFFQASVADVGDNSYFAFTSPVRGARYRVELGATTGTATYGSLLADFRNYIFLRPVTVAMRAMHYGRYGKDADNPILSQLFLGYESLVRGYSQGSFDPSECTGPGCPEFERLLGSRLALASAELRIPLFGTSDFGLIDFPYLPTEISFFGDGGVAWTGIEGGSPVFNLATRSTERIPVFSAGVSARVNLFGYLVGEVFYVYPFQRPDKGWHWGFQLSPGW